VALELSKDELVMQLDLLLFVVNQEHIHQQEAVPDGFSPGMVDEVNSSFSFSRLLNSLDLGNPGLQLVSAVEIVVSIPSVIVFFLLPVPDVVISAMEPVIGMI